MIITISGFAGSGKDSAAKLLAKKLNIRHINFTFKDAALKMGIPLMEYHDMAKKDPEIDKKFDAMVVEEARKQDCVTSTWLGPWLIKESDLKIWLDASPEIRAKRISGRDGFTLTESIDEIKKRDAHNRVRYKRLYGVDIFTDRDIFDLIIKTESFYPENIANIIKAAIVEKFEKKI